MFKAGDTVRAKFTVGGLFTKGKTYTVKSCGTNDLFIEATDRGTLSNGCFPGNFELVTEKYTPKVGDRVRCIQGVPGLSRYGAHGDHAKVRAIRPTHGTMQVTLEKDGRTLWVAVERFEKVEEAAPKATPEAHLQGG